MKDYFGYQGKTCVVLGGSNGMGREGINLLLDMGAKVINMDIEPNDIDGVEFIPVNLQERDSIDEAFAKLPETFDCFFGYAGISGVNQPAEMVLKVNLLSYVYMMKKYLYDRVNKGGTITLVSSTSGRFWDKYVYEYKYLLDASWDDSLKFIEANKDKLKGLAPYGMGKRAMNYMVKTNLDKFWEKEIRLNTVCPAFTTTRLYDAFFTYIGSDQKKLETMYRGAITRDATPLEVAQVVVFVGSEMSGYMDGEEVLVDGGRQAQSESRIMSVDPSDAPSFSTPPIYNF